MPILTQKYPGYNADFKQKYPGYNADLKQKYPGYNADSNTEISRIQC